MTSPEAIDAPTGLLSAILAVQGEAPTLKKTASNPAFKGSKYAPLDTIVETIGPILHKHGLVWMTLPGSDASGAPALSYRLAHAATGEVLEGVMPLLLSKNDAQGMGSAITYARRYALTAVLNLVSDDDDDGARAVAGRSSYGNANTASEKQLKYVRSLLKQHKLTTVEVRASLRAVGVAIEDDANPVPIVYALNTAQANALIDRLKDGPVPTGTTDVPANGDEFKHPPSGDYETESARIDAEAAAADEARVSG